MNFIRKIINSDKLNNIIQIPEDLRHQNVEILILPLQYSTKKSVKKFDPDDYSGILKLDEGVIEDRIKSMREEWDRF